MQVRADRVQLLGRDLATSVSLLGDPHGRWRGRRHAGSWRGSGHGGFPGHGDPQDDVSEDPRPAQQGRDDEQDADQRGVHVQVTGQAAAYPRDDSVVLRADEPWAVHAPYGPSASRPASMQGSPEGLCYATRLWG